MHAGGLLPQCGGACSYVIFILYKHILVCAQVIYGVMVAFQSGRLSESTCALGVQIFHEDHKLIPAGVPMETWLLWAAKQGFAVRVLGSKFKKIKNESDTAKDKKLNELKAKLAADSRSTGSKAGAVEFLEAAKIWDVLCPAAEPAQAPSLPAAQPPVPAQAPSLPAAQPAVPAQPAAQPAAQLSLQLQPTKQAEAAPELALPARALSLLIARYVHICW